MDFELYKKIAEEIFPKTRVLYLSCNAEPLCTSNIGDYLLFAKKFRIPFISMTSNCMLLSEKVINELIDNGLDELIVSVTGGTKETYESNHINAKWDLLWEHLSQLEQKKKEKHKTTPVIKFNYITTKQSINEMNLFIEKVRVFKPQYLTLRELVVFPDMDREFYETNRLTSEDQFKIAEAKRSLIKAGIQPIDSLQCTAEGKRTIPNVSDNYPCIEPFFQLFIGPTGDVKVCNNLAPIGNIVQESLSSTLKSSEKSGFLKRLKKKISCNCIVNCPNFKN